MDFVRNEPEQIAIRRNQNTLIVVGSGTILFSIWTAIKMLSMLFILKNETVEAFRVFFEEDVDPSDGVVFFTAILAGLIILTVTLSIRLYVGRSAIAEGRGRSRGNLYLILAVILVISNMITICTGFTTNTAETQQTYGALTRDQSISTMIIDLTSTIMLIEMVIASLRIRKLRGKPKHAKKR